MKMIRRICIYLLPYGIIKLLAPYISTYDDVGRNVYYRILSNKYGAELLIQDENYSKKNREEE